MKPNFKLIEALLKEQPYYLSKDIGAQPDVPGGQFTRVQGPEYAFGPQPGITGQPQYGSIVDNALAALQRAGFPIGDPQQTQALIAALQDQSGKQLYGI